MQALHAPEPAAGQNAGFEAIAGFSEAELYADCYDPEAGLQPVDFGADPPSSCYRLTSEDGVLWSIGASDVFALDGATWSRVD